MNPRSESHCRFGSRIAVRRAWAARCGTALVGLSMLAAGAVRAQTRDANLLDLSIEELLHVEITSASKKTQRISETAAAAFVITQDDIRRSGARSIPEVLRMAPGIEVAQIDGNTWAVTARGFNGRFANKLLVLMDGRALYTPSFGGVFWDVQDTLMEDIERIEVIRGPGGTLWGANAVNGVINIITRSSRNTQGTELVAGAASGPSKEGSLQYGGRLDLGASDPGPTYRIYAKYLDLAGNEDLTGRSTADDWQQGRAGVRVDWSSAAGDQLSLTAEAYDGNSGETLTHSLPAAPYETVVDAVEEVSGFFTVAGWHREVAEGRQIEAQAYVDETRRSGLLFGEDRTTAVLNLQYRFPIGSRQDVVTGAGVRHNAYDFSATSEVSVSPSRPSNVGYNGFLQDEVQLVQNRLALTVGVDLEHNPLSEHNVDALPSGRILWTLDERNHVWGAVTKAISTPSFEDTGASVRNAAPIIPAGAPQNPFPVPIVTSVESNPTVGSETLVAYELGYRTEPRSNISLDATLYRHDYEALRDAVDVGLYCDPSQLSVKFAPACLFGAVDLVDKIQFQNSVRGRSSGIELAADWVPAGNLRLRATYTFLRMQLEPYIAGPDLVQDIEQTEGGSPRNQFSLRSDVTLTTRMDLDVAVRHVDSLPSIPVPAYWSADANLLWRLRPSCEVAVTGRNLLRQGHLEFISELADVVPTQIERTVGVKIRWTF